MRAAGGSYQWTIATSSGTLPANGSPYSSRHAAVCYTWITSRLLPEVGGNAMFQAFLFTENLEMLHKFSISFQDIQFEFRSEGF